MIKQISKKILGIHNIYYLINLRLLLLNFKEDLKLFMRYSTVFRANNFKNKEALIILAYHSIEKGFLFKKIKPQFAKHRVIKLHSLLSDKQIISTIASSQIEVAYRVMCQYYEVHEDLKTNISEFYTQEQYDIYKSLIGYKNKSLFNSVVEYNRSEFYKKNNEDFESFSWSRKSVRNYTGAKIERNLIEKAISLASNAPSVCNRQASKVYLIENKSKIDEILKIQGGFTGYSENVVQLLIVTSDRNYFYTVGERNQFYIDGGIFLMNLLYALHFYKIANCPANWGKLIRDEKLLQNYVTLPQSEKIICMIPIGVAQNEFRITLSKRRSLKEIFKVID